MEFLCSTEELGGSAKFLSGHLAARAGSGGESVAAGWGVGVLPFSITVLLVAQSAS